MRTEKDSLGTLELPDEAYYGIQTARARENFPISGLRTDPLFIRAYALLKQAAAEANERAGVLDAERSKAIRDAAREVAEGKWNDQFVVDVFQAGAGTSTNMNVNEVIANRALELLGAQRGDATRLSPNDHVNMSQSTNDSYPTAMRLAMLLVVRDDLAPAMAQIAAAFERKADEFRDHVKSGRTHLQDAVPITLGQEFSAWAEMIRRHEERIDFACSDLSRLGIGGTAAGSGLNAPAHYREYILESLRKLTDLDVSLSANMFEAMQSLAPFVTLSSALRNLALDLFKISADLRLLASGPMTGLAEITLPAVQPGSSIMPGKVNPSMLEMASQVALQVVGCDTVVAFASQAGQLELNVMMPVVQYDVMFAMRILSATLRVVSERCIDGITADRERLKHYAESSGSLVTALAPEIGYLQAAEIAKESLKTRRSIRQIVLERKLLTAEQLDAILDVRKMAKGE
jgi:aspartate ammonia-lyase